MIFCGLFELKRKNQTVTSENFHLWQFLQSIHIPLALEHSEANQIKDEFVLRSICPKPLHHSFSI